MKCPKCAQPLELTSNLASESLITFSVKPGGGKEFISAMHFGGLIRSMARLIDAVGRDGGAEAVDVVIHDVSKRKDGELRVDFLIMRRGGNVTPSDQGDKGNG